MQWKKFLAVAAIALVVSCALSNAARADILPGSKLWQQMVELFRINPRMPSVSQTDRHSPDPVLSESQKTRTPVHSVKSDTVFTPGYHYHEPEGSRHPRQPCAVLAKGAVQKSSAGRD